MKEDGIPVLTNKVEDDDDWMHFNCHGQRVPPENSVEEWIDNMWDDDSIPLNPDGSHTAESYAHMAVAAGGIEELAEVSKKLTDLAGVIDETNKGKKE